MANMATTYYHHPPLPPPPSSSSSIYPPPPYAGAPPPPAPPQHTQPYPSHHHHDYGYDYYHHQQPPPHYVPYDAPYGASPDEVRTLFVAGLPGDVRAREIYNLFREFPGYESSHLRNSGKSSQQTDHRMSAHGEGTLPAL